jgi:glycosyltransferase involved in cell wall biosynthesis
VLEVVQGRVERRRVPRVHLRPASSSGRRLAVCLYTPSYDPSGMGGHMVDLAAEYASHADVTLMAWPTTAGQRLLDAAAQVGATPVALPHPRDRAFAGAVVQRLRDAPVDVFHGHVGTGREDFDGARAARRAGVPTVVQTLHLPWQLGSHKHRVPFFSSLRPLDRVLTVSAGQRRTYERIGVRPELLRTVPNGIRARGQGPGRSAARRALGLRDDQPVLLTVGRLVAQKGHRTLVAAVPALAARFPDVAVVVLGSGPLHEPLVRQAAELGVAQHVHLPGFRADARQLLDAADVFALPSRQEAMPLAALEAMDARLPVVATRVDGSTEVVVDGVTGRLVRRDDPAALAGALGDLLADSGLRAAYGAAGHERFRSRYTSARMAEQTLDVYRELRTGPLAHRP